MKWRHLLATFAIAWRRGVDSVKNACIKIGKRRAYVSIFLIFNTSVTHVKLYTTKPDFYSVDFKLLKLDATRNLWLLANVCLLGIAKLC